MEENREGGVSASDSSPLVADDSTSPLRIRGLDLLLRIDRGDFADEPDGVRVRLILGLSGMGGGRPTTVRQGDEFCRDKVRG